MTRDEDNGMTVPVNSGPATHISARPDVSKELAALKFERKNQGLIRLPANTTIERRPLTHAPIASPFSGAEVPKCVYVSCKTPVMAAVKRVKKLLSHVEKRAMQNVDLTKGNNQQNLRKLAGASEKLGGDKGEKVYVKASGRAMEQALRVAEWFRSREEEVMCRVEVKTGSVQAIDDIVEVESSNFPDEVDEADDGECPHGKQGPEEATRALIHSDMPGPAGSTSSANEQNLGTNTGSSAAAKTEPHSEKRRRRGKRKRATDGQDDLPEARTRWIKTIEISISLKG